MKHNTGKVVIGQEYRAPWFERKFSDGRYEAFNPPMSDDAYRVQRALLGEPDGENVMAWAAIAVWVVCLSLLFIYAP